MSVFATYLAVFKALQIIEGHCLCSPGDCYTFDFQEEHIIWILGTKSVVYTSFQSEIKKCNAIL